MRTPWHYALRTTYRSRLAPNQHKGETHPCIKTCIKTCINTYVYTYIGIAPERQRLNKQLDTSLRPSLSRIAARDLLALRHGQSSTRDGNTHNRLGHTKLPHERGSPHRVATALQHTTRVVLLLMRLYVANRFGYGGDLLCFFVRNFRFEFFL